MKWIEPTNTFYLFYIPICTISIKNQGNLSNVENGRRLDPYQGSFNESPAFPSYPPISRRYLSFSLPSLNSAYWANLMIRQQSLVVSKLCLFWIKYDLMNPETWAQKTTQTNTFYCHQNLLDLLSSRTRLLLSTKICFHFRAITLDLAYRIRICSHPNPDWNSPVDLHSRHGVE